MTAEISGLHKEFPITIFRMLAVFRIYWEETDLSLSSAGMHLRKKY